MTIYVNIGSIGAWAKGPREREREIYLEIEMIIATDGNAQGDMYHFVTEGWNISSYN